MSDANNDGGGAVALRKIKLPVREDGQTVDDVLRNRELKEDGFTREKVACNRGPTYEFWGKLLGEYSTNAKGDRTKWTELRLWETPSRQWVAESAGCSDEAGHVDILDAIVIRGPVVLVNRQTMKDYVDQTPQTISMEFQAMEFWGWSSPAKALAKKLGWNLVVIVP